MYITRVNPLTDPEAVQGIVSVYRASFGGAPWNEGHRCPVCEKVFALTPDLEVCPSCAERAMTVLLVDYWPASTVISDLYREMGRSDPICMVARADGGEVIGVAWGYKVSVNHELSDHLDAPGIHEALRPEDFFYLDECALTPSHQGKGLGKLLVHRIFQEQRHGQALLRTLMDSRMYKLITNMGGRTIQEISRGRVIMKVTL